MIVKVDRVSVLLSSRTQYSVISGKFVALIQTLGGFSPRGAGWGGAGGTGAPPPPPYMCQLSVFVTVSVEIKAAPG